MTRALSEILAGFENDVKTKKAPLLREGLYARIGNCLGQLVNRLTRREFLYNLLLVFQKLLAISLWFWGLRPGRTIAFVVGFQKFVEKEEEYGHPIFP